MLKDTNNYKTLDTLNYFYELSALQWKILKLQLF